MTEEDCKKCCHCVRVALTEECICELGNNPDKCDDFSKEYGNCMKKADESDKEASIMAGLMEIINSETFTKGQVDKLVSELNETIANGDEVLFKKPDVDQ